MSKIITAKFVRRRFQDSGSSQAPDYFVYEFTDIVDEKGNKITDKWIKETKLLKTVSFQEGKQYEITLNDRVFSVDSIRLPFPKEIVCDNERVYMKGGNSIVKALKGKEEKNLSIPINKITGVSNYDTAAFNKFSKGLMTEDLLLKMNARGIFYYVHFYDPQDRRKFGDSSIGYSKSSKENQVLIQKETQSEIERALDTIKSKYVTIAIEKHFNFKTELLPPKKRKK
jgi:hypothetical protein